VISVLEKVTRKPLEARIFPSLSKGFTWPWPGKETRKRWPRDSETIFLSRGFLTGKETEENEKRLMYSRGLDEFGSEW
jgi:hypothetical protein